MWFSELPNFRAEPKGPKDTIPRLMPTHDDQAISNCPICLIFLSIFFAPFRPFSPFLRDSLFLLGCSIFPNKVPGASYASDARGTRIIWLSFIVVHPPGLTRWLFLIHPSTGHSRYTRLALTIHRYELLRQCLQALPHLE